MRTPPPPLRPHADAGTGAPDHRSTEAEVAERTAMVIGRGMPRSEAAISELAPFYLSLFAVGGQDPPRHGWLLAANLRGAIHFKVRS